MVVMGGGYKTGLAQGGKSFHPFPASHEEVTRIGKRVAGKEYAGLRTHQFVSVHRRNRLK